ncbi:aminotransferase class IV [Agrococcus sp. SGAir0287]|uniref:aminotransferase class IV n=1 Tax=Agrococcus sp. SGAir0287 TaxID=2070347 RepID=UPI0010CCC408|nr:aminotransferase class IV [Agrococcus sp. SGAir0287]QCR19079.1 4-amino-4-deoxychorismate lyase [Agrococcus sp. SGAir0287]
MTAPLLALLDGSIVDVATPIVRADDLGVVRGDGVFDATLVRRGALRDADAHLDRLARSARLLALPQPDRDGYRRAIDALVAAWDWDAAPEAVARLVLTRGPEGGGPATAYVLLQALSASVIAERTSGVRVQLLDRGFDGEVVASMPWLLPGAKSLSYAINMAARRHALEHGADDVLFVAPSGRLLEGPTSTLVLDVDGELLTPEQDGILASITLEQLERDAPAAGLTVRHAPLVRDDLARARGGWLVSSGRLAAAITAIDGEPYPASPLHEALFRVLEVHA